MDEWTKEWSPSSYGNSLVRTTSDFADFTQCQCLLTKLAVHMKHALWCLFREWVRLLGHPEAVWTIFGVSTLLLTQSHFLPLCHVLELKNIHSPILPSFRLKLQLTREVSALTFFPNKREVQPHRGACKND